MNRTVLREVPIRDLVVKASTWNPVRDAANDEIAYIDLSAIDNVTKAVNGFQSLAGRDAPSRARQLVQAGDILVSTVRPNLNGVARVPDELDGATASTGFCILRPRSEKIDSSFLFHWVQSPNFVDDMVRKATGASYPAVSDKMIFQSKIQLPPLKEQKRIAAILDQASELRRKRLHAIKRLNQLGQAIFHEMFGDVAESRKTNATIADVSDRVTKGESPKWQGHSYVSDGALFVTSENVGWGVLLDKEPKFVPIEFHDGKLARSKLKNGDVLVNLVGASIGRACIFQSKYVEANINQAVAVVTLKREFQISDYLLTYLLSPWGQEQILGSRVEGARANISLKDVRDFSFYLPPPKERDQFTERVRAVADSKNGAALALKQLRTIEASLQHYAFRGEL